MTLAAWFGFGCCLFCVDTLVAHTSCLVCPTLLGGELLGPGGPVAAWVGNLSLIKFCCGLFCLDFMGVGCLGCVGLEVGL